MTRWGFIEVVVGEAAGGATSAMEARGWEVPRRRTRARRDARVIHSIAHRREGAITTRHRVKPFSPILETVEKVVRAIR